MVSSAALDLDQYWHDGGARGFGDVHRVSNRVRQRFSVASQLAADNLLAKALRAIEAGDHERASGYIQRAVALPFDEHEQEYPGLTSAHLRLFMMVADTMDECLEDDTVWLDAALDVLGSAADEARLELRDVLSDIDQDYLLSGPEHDRLRAAISSIPPRPDAWDLLLPPEEQHRLVTAVLAACTAYERAVIQRAGE